MLDQIRYLTPIEALVALVDIAIVSYVLYRFFMLIRGTRAIQLLKGIVVLLIATTVSGWLQLYTIHWLLEKVQLALVVALPIVFQPELRRALEQIGRGGFFVRGLSALGREDVSRLIGELTRAAELMSRHRVGALMVVERETGLSEYTETGIKVDALVSAEFLYNVFVPNAPLHDGAVIIRGNRVLAAACFLPLSEAPDLSKDLGGRHRAAIGITELSDAVAVVISEETGSISLANDGKLIRNLDPKTLQEMLTALCEPKARALRPWWGRG